MWLFARTATNYSPLVPAVAVIGTLVSALVVISLVILRKLLAGSAKG